MNTYCLAKRLFASLGLCLGLLTLASQAALAEIKFIVPQNPGGGTSVWASIVARELEKQLGERIRIVHLPGARNTIGFDKFHNEYKDDPDVAMVSHGGNAVSFLQEDVNYDYALYDPVAVMSFNIVALARDPDAAQWVFAERSGTVPESLALAMLYGWGNVTYVKGMTTAETRLAFRRGEVTLTRENPAAFKKHFLDMVQADTAAPLFHHGLFDGARFADDPNFRGVPTVGALYKSIHGQSASSHELYGAYAMVTAWRDGLQKAIWVHKGNPNGERLRAAVRKMLADPSSRAHLEEKLGAYPWRVGAEAQAFLKSLYPLITEASLKRLVDFNANALGIASIFNPARVHRSN